jgi:hypothetical protein
MDASYKRWLGVGVKSGGQLLIGGVESTTARLWNLGDGESFDLEVFASRWGLGLGGGGGAVAVIGFGFSVPYELDGKPSNDWGVNFAITERLISKSLITSLAVAITLARAAKAARIAKLSVDTLGQLRNLAHTLYEGYEASKQSGVVMIDAPGAGVGLEVSAYVTRGTMHVSNSSYYYPGLSDD